MEDELKLRKVTLEINSEDIEHGIHNSCSKCILGRAVGRVVKKEIGLKVFIREEYFYSERSSHEGVTLLKEVGGDIYFEFELRLPKEFTGVADAWEYNHEERILTEMYDSHNTWNKGKWPDKFPITCEVEIPERFLKNEDTN